jgi:hypothetical protein
VDDDREVDKQVSGVCKWSIVAAVGGLRMNPGPDAG